MGMVVVAVGTVAGAGLETVEVAVDCMLLVEAWHFGD